MLVLGPSAVVRRMEPEATARQIWTREEFGVQRTDAWEEDTTVCFRNLIWYKHMQKC